MVSQPQFLDYCLSKDLDHFNVTIEYTNHFLEYSILYGLLIKQLLALKLAIFSKHRESHEGITVSIDSSYSAPLRETCRL
jgi:hypothetical protein